MPDNMRVLFVGDIVGRSGRNALAGYLPQLKEEYGYDLLIINGENAAHGKGITRKIYDQLVALGADCITLGNHAFSKDNVLTFIRDADRLIRPENMLPVGIGSSVKIIEREGTSIGIFNIYGSVFMDQCSESPFTAFARLMEEHPCDIRIVDFHGEATGEKYLFMEYFRKDCQLIVGTHTHVQTADEAIHQGCGFICDVGMTGPYDSIIGRDTAEVIDNNVHNLPTRYTVAQGEGILSAVICDIDLVKKEATAISRIQIRPDAEEKQDCRNDKGVDIMPVTVNKELCLGCGACTEVCPVGALALGEDGLAESNQDICIDCGACVATCPVGAISQD